MMFRAAIFAISCIIFLFWSMHALRNSFKIVLKGLQCCYHIWLFHLFLLILEYTYHGMRPIWKSEPAGYIYSNSITCIIHGKVPVNFAICPDFVDEPKSRYHLSLISQFCYEAGIIQNSMFPKFFFQKSDNGVL